MNKTPAYIVLFSLVVGILLLAGAYFVPWENISWGTMAVKPTSTITVIGNAKGQIRNQIAQFSAGVSVVNDNKDVAVSEVNNKVSAIIEKVKAFGIDTKDIKTQNMSIHQDEQTYYEDSVQKRRPGQWRVSNTIQIILRDVDRASELADLLSSSGANNIYGPSFSVDDTDVAENELLSKSLENAMEKASEISHSSGKTLGKIISISEGANYGQGPVMMMDGMGGGGGAPVQPGGSTVQKSVTVVFELK